MGGSRNARRWKGKDEPTEVVGADSHTSPEATSGFASSSAGRRLQNLLHWAVNRTGLKTSATSTAACSSRSAKMAPESSTYIVAIDLTSSSVISVS